MNIGQISIRYTRKAHYYGNTPPAGRSRSPSARYLLCGNGICARDPRGLSAWKEEPDYRTALAGAALVEKARLGVLMNPRGSGQTVCGRSRVVCLDLQHSRFIVFDKLLGKLNMQRG